jgi:hypothetical protein
MYHSRDKSQAAALEQANACGSSQGSGGTGTAHRERLGTSKQESAEDDQRQGRRQGHVDSSAAADESIARHWACSRDLRRVAKQPLNRHIYRMITIRRQSINSLLLPVSSNTIQWWILSVSHP